MATSSSTGWTRSTRTCLTCSTSTRWPLLNERGKAGPSEGREVQARQGQRLLHHRRIQSIFPHFAVAAERPVQQRVQAGQPGDGRMRSPRQRADQRLPCRRRKGRRGGNAVAFRSRLQPSCATGAAAEGNSFPLRQGEPHRPRHGSCRTGRQDAQWHGHCHSGECRHAVAER